MVTVPTIVLPAPHSEGPPFRRSAIPGVRVRVKVNPSGPPEWLTSRMADRNQHLLHVLGVPVPGIAHE